MAIKETNLTPYEGDIKAGQRLIKVGDAWMPVGVGGMYEPGSSRVVDIGKGVYYKCASVNTETGKWSGYKAIQTGGEWSFVEELTTGLSYSDIVPVPGTVYSYDALIVVGKMFPTSDSMVDEYIWGYNRGELLPDNTLTATNRGSVTADADGYYTYGKGKYFDFDESVMTGASPRTFILQATISGTTAIQFIDGGTRSHHMMFGLGWGYNTNKLFHHFWSGDNSSWIDLPAGDYILAFVYDGSVLTAYKDGEVIGTHTITLNTGSSSPYRIGQCVIDDWYAEGEWKSNFCAVYDRALTQEEITTVTEFAMGD